MSRCLAYRIAAGLFCSVILAFTARPAVASDDQDVLQAEESLLKALKAGDATAAGTLLDTDFQWVNADGKIRTKAQALADLSAFEGDDEGQIGVQLRNYGRVERVLGIHRDTRFAHIWVKRGSGWQALVYLDTPIPAVESSITPRRPSAADKECENPCKSLPYQPKTASEQAVLETWFKLKNDEWHPNPEDWAAHADDDHVTITPRFYLPKAQHVALLAQERDAYGLAPAGAPAISIRLFDFGNAVVMTALHGRDTAKPSTWVLRLFIHRGAGWKIALSDQTSIK
jgi:Domain of unknown function (DUF4440)